MSTNKLHNKIKPIKNQVDDLTERIIERVKNYNKQNNYKPIVSCDKRKEYNKIAYQKRKEKLEKEKLENQNI